MQYVFFCVYACVLSTRSRYNCNLSRWKFARARLIDKTDSCRSSLNRFRFKCSRYTDDSARPSFVKLTPSSRPLPPADQIYTRRSEENRHRPRSLACSRCITMHRLEARRLLLHWRGRAYLLYEGIPIYLPTYLRSCARVGAHRPRRWEIVVWKLHRQPRRVRLKLGQVYDNK